MFRLPLKMRFFHDACVTDLCSCKIGIPYILYIRSVLEASCIIHTLRFCARIFLVLIARDGMYAGFAGAKACHKKSLFLEAPFGLLRSITLLIMIIPLSVVQAEEIRDPMQPPAYALEKYRQAKFKNKVNPVKTSVKVKKPVVKPLRLTSILYSSDRKIAIIDDRMLRVGDTIRSAKLIRIDRDGARLLKKGKIIELNLRDDFSAIKKTPSESKL